MRNHRPALRDRPARAVAAAVGLATLAAGCGGAGPAGSAGRGPAQSQPLDVVASAYPLAQLASYIGGKYVRVSDLAPPLLAAAGLRLGAHQAALVHSAGLVVVVGDGYQPAIESAAAKRPDHYIALLPAVSSRAQPYEFWLDPSLMSKAARALASAMERLDPAGAGQFRNGARDMESVASSLSSDLSSNFANCSKRDFVTEDDAFGRMAAAFGLHDVAVSTLGVDQAASLVRRQDLPTVFSESGAGSSGIEQVAALTGTTVKTLDPLEAAPQAGTKALSYFAVMEQDLTYLETGLSCDTSANFS